MCVTLRPGRGWVAVPSQERHLHSTPLPRLGGVAIFISFSLSMAVAAAGSGLICLTCTRRFSLKTLLTILVPASIVFLLGVYDDLHTVGPYVKFAVQSLAATMLFMGGLRISISPYCSASINCRGLWDCPSPFCGSWPSPTRSISSMAWTDWLPGSALFSTLVAFVVALLNGYSLVTVMTIALAGAILGFLRYNFNPATIFLGDSGSLFIGFLLSALALEGAQKAPTIVAVAIPVVSFGLPILETALSILRRLISGRPVFTADREHIHHKLLQHGLTHRQVVIVLYGVSAIFALLSLFLALAHRKFSGLGARGAWNRHLDWRSAPRLSGIRRVGSRSAAHVRSAPDRDQQSRDPPRHAKNSKSSTTTNKSGAFCRLPSTPMISTVSTFASNFFPANFTLQAQ